MHLKVNTSSTRVNCDMNTFKGNIVSKFDEKMRNLMFFIRTGYNDIMIYRLNI